MRILFVLGGFRIGGYEILSVKIANELVSRKNNVAIVSLSNDSQILEMINPRVETYFVTRSFKLDLSLISRLIKILNNFEPDIIFSCAFFPYFICRFSSFLLLQRPKFILAFHVTEPFNHKEDRWNQIYATFAKMFNDRYIAIHRSQIDFHSNRYGLPRSRFTLIHNGVDTKYFRPKEIKEHQNNGIFRITHIASLKPLKDQWTLLKSMVELNKTYKHWELKIVGEDHSNIILEFKDFVKRHNLTTQVKFLGPVDDTMEVLRNSDVFVLTSITEALPISVIEAIATGLPCVVTNVGGITDIIEDGKEGFLVNVGDYKAIAYHLKLLIDNPNKRNEMSYAARRKALNQFDFNIMIDKYCDLFYSLTNQ